MYKVILFNHGETAANGRVLLDTSSGENPGLTQAVVETKLNEAGSIDQDQGGNLRRSAGLFAGL